MFSAAILAGGAATRFGGRDKSALLVDGRTILERQLSELWLVTGDIMIVHAGVAHGEALKGCATTAGVRTISDRVPGSGPLGGLHAALQEARGSAVFVLACDMPYVTAPLVSLLLTGADGADAVVPQTERGYHPLCAVYRQTCLEAVTRRLARRELKMLDLLDEVRTRVVAAEEIAAFGDPDRLLANVNTSAEYESLETVQRHKL